MKFEDVLEIKNGRNQRAVENPNGKYPIYGSGGIMGYADDYICDAQTVVIGRKGSINNPLFVEEPFWNVDTAFGLRANTNLLLPRYLYYFCKNFDFEKLNRTVTIPSLTKSDLLKIEIDLPDLVEQQNIINILDKVSRLIDQRQKQLSKLDELVKARFVELFDTKGYPEIAIGELVASKVNSAKKVFAPTDTIKYIDISSIDNKRNVMTGYTEYVFEEAPSRAQQHIKKGDIVVSTVRPNLKNVAITDYTYDNLVASSGFCVLRAVKCLPAYLMAVVCSDDFTDAMTKVVTGANYPAIKDSDVRSYVVPNPPFELQEQFTSFVEQVDKSKFEVKESLEKLETLKKALMQEYFG